VIRETVLWNWREPETEQDATANWDQMEFDLQLPDNRTSATAS
jgi:hypothetical protein